MNDQVRGRFSINGMPGQVITLAMIGLAVSIASGKASAQDAERSGKQVVDAVCASCHAKGTNGAPRIGDKQAWAKRANQGLTGLTAHALEGIRKMPAHGGNMSLKDVEVARAIAYMVNRSGGKWTEPISKTAATPARSGEQIVHTQCGKCHQTGEGGAPRIGDRDAWIKRVSQGLDAVVNSAIRGHGGMPARGGMASLTDLEMRNAVVYMFSQANAPKK